MDIELLGSLAVIVASAVGVTWKISQAIQKANESLYQKIDGRFKQIDQRFEKIDQRFEKIDQKFEKMDQRFEKMEENNRVVFQKICQIEAILWAAGVHPEHKQARENHE